jgi:hypothetical protein
MGYRNDNTTNIATGNGAEPTMPPLIIAYIRSHRRIHPSVYCTKPYAATTTTTTTTTTATDMHVANAMRTTIDVNARALYTCSAEPETLYMVVSGKHFNGACCFDYGNAETDPFAMPQRPGTMESIYFGTNCDPHHGCGTGTGPWVRVHCRR